MASAVRSFVGQIVEFAACLNLASVAGIVDLLTRRSAAGPSISQSCALEDLWYACIECGPATGSSVWRNRASRRVVDPPAHRILRTVGFPRLLDVGRIPG